MELISFVLFAGGNVLFKAIIIFLTSIVSGLGLGIGLYTVKGWLERRKARKEAKKQAKELGERELTPEREEYISNKYKNAIAEELAAATVAK